MKTNLLFGGLALALIAATVPAGAYHPVSPYNGGYIQVEDVLTLCETDGVYDPYNGGVLNQMAHPGLGGMCYMTGNPSAGPVWCRPDAPIPMPICTTPAPPLSGGFSTFTVSASNSFRMTPFPGAPPAPVTQNVPFQWSVADQFGLADEQGVCVSDDYAQLNDDGHVAAYVPLVYEEIHLNTVVARWHTVPYLTWGHYTATSGACNPAFVAFGVDGFGNPLGVVFADYDAQNDLAL